MMQGYHKLDKKLAMKLFIRNLSRPGVRFLNSGFLNDWVINK